MANLCHSSLIPFKHIYGGSSFLVPLIWRSCALRFLTHSGFTGFCPMNWIAAQPSFGEEPASTNHHGSSRSFKPCKFSDCEAEAPVLRFRDRLHCAAGDAVYPAPLRWSGPGPESVQLAGLEPPHQIWDPSLNGISIASLNKCLVVCLLDLVWCWWNVDNILCGFNARRRQEFQLLLTMTKLQILLIAPRIPSARTWPQGWWMLHAAPTPVLSGTNPCFALILFVLACEHGSPKAAKARGRVKLVGINKKNTGTSQRMQFGVKVPDKSSHNMLPFGNILDPDTNVLLIWWAGKIAL